tara:strand:+ start:2386 stop:2571 length:186 start_codon:yes stop_codon:yes gene_type:complete
MMQCLADNSIESSLDNTDFFYTKKEKPTFEKIEYLENRIENIRSFLLSIKEHVGSNTFTNE